jgi:hypothetical protein
MTDSKAKKTREIGGRAVGAYLRTLREHEGLSPTEVAAQIKTDATQIWRVENWKTDARCSILFGFIRAVNGSATDIELLINNPKATAEEGISLAKLRISIKQPK